MDGRVETGKDNEGPNIANSYLKNRTLRRAMIDHDEEDN